MRQDLYKTPKEKSQAMGQVGNAVRKGELLPITTLLCMRCLAPAQHYHHHLGYRCEHYLDVLPVCVKCHSREHS